MWYMWHQRLALHLQHLSSPPRQHLMTGTILYNVSDPYRSPKMMANQLNCLTQVGCKKYERRKTVKNFASQVKLGRYSIFLEWFLLGGALQRKKLVLMIGFYGKIGWPLECNSIFIWVDPSNRCQLLAQWIDQKPIREVMLGTNSIECAMQKMHRVQKMFRWTLF